MSSETQGVGRAATLADLPIVAACLASAFYEDPLPSYLESTNPVNLPRYEALGFRRIHEFAPLGGPTVTTMWREAH